MPLMTQKKKYCFDEKITLRIKDRRGGVAREFPAGTARQYDRAMRVLDKMNGVKKSRINGI